MLVTHEHPMRLPFVMDAHFPADIYNHLFNGAGKWPGILTRIVSRDRLTTIPSHVQPLASNRELARLRPDLAFADLLVIDVDSQGSVGNMRWVLRLLNEDGRQRRGPSRHRLAGTDLL